MAEDHTKHEERFHSEQPSGDESPEHYFDRRWAVALVERAMFRLKERCAAKGQEKMHDVLSPLLSLDSVPGAEINPSGIAQALELSEATARVALHRFREDFRKCLLAEVTLTVADESEVKSEISYLLSLFGRS